MEQQNGKLRDIIKMRRFEALQTVTLDKQCLLYYFFRSLCIKTQSEKQKLNVTNKHLDSPRTAQHSTASHLCLVMCTWNINMFCGVSTYSFCSNIFHTHVWFSSLSNVFIFYLVQVHVNRFHNISNLSALVI